MSEEQDEIAEIKTIKDFVKDGRFDDTVNIIALYLGDSTEEDYIDRLENIIETLLSLHGGTTVLRFLLENLIIDIPSLLENLSKKDSVLRYTFLLLLRTICENESDLFLPYSEDLLKSDDPNVREADLQLLIYMADSVAAMEDQSLIKAIVDKLNDEKEFVVEKAIQALITIGRKSPTIITKILTDYAKENVDITENEKLKASIDTIMKSIVTVEKIEEIVEEEKSKLEKPSEDTISGVTPSLDLEKEETEILDKEFELKKKELEIKKKKLELEEKEKEIEEKVIQKKEEVLKLKEEILIKEGDISEELDLKEKTVKVKIPKKLKKEESEIINKELELKKKDLEIKKKKLEIEEREKELEEKEILEREKALKLKEELIEKEKELSQVELELKQKSLEQKEENIKKEEMKRVEGEVQRRIEDEEEDT
ncbi:MAG: HEAT repeat domain-containing protein [Candidatus Hermodarchaeota archaeon]